LGPFGPWGYYTDEDAEDMDYEDHNKDLMLVGASDSAGVEDSPKKVQEKNRQRKEEVNEGVAN
jgi:hypothetical protein